MAETAPQIQYRQETIAAFEQQQTLVRGTVTTEAVIKGNQATFLVAGSGNATAVTRGINGLIPARPDDLNQYTVTLTERHDLVRKSGYNVFISQGDQNALMQRTTMGVMNREMDQDIITILNTATQDTGAAQTGGIEMALYAKTILGNAKVPFDGQISALITPAFEAYLLRTREFSGAEYVTRKPLEGADLAWQDAPGFYRWLGVNWLVHPELPGAGTNAEKCFMYHKNALGHAINSSGIDSAIGYDDEQQYSWARTSAFMGALLLQNSGIVVMNHDGSDFVAQ